MAKLPTLVPLSDEEQRLVSEVSADFPAVFFIFAALTFATKHTKLTNANTKV